MTNISKPNTFSPNTTAKPSEVNANFDTIYNDYNGNINASNLADSAVTSAKIADSAVTTAKVASNAISTAKIPDSAITTAKINDSAVTTAKIADSNVTGAKLGTDAGGGAWTAWTPTVTGASGTPTTTNCRYKQIGKTIIMQVEITGTSNTNSKTFTLPVAANANAFAWSAVYNSDNGTDKLGMMRVFASTSTTAATVYAGMSAGVGGPVSGWAGSGAFAIRGELIYEAA